MPPEPLRAASLVRRAFGKRLSDALLIYNEVRDAHLSCGNRTKADEVPSQPWEGEVCLGRRRDSPYTVKTNRKVAAVHEELTLSQEHGIGVKGLLSPMPRCIIVGKNSKLCTVDARSSYELHTHAHCSTFHYVLLQLSRFRVGGISLNTVTHKLKQHSLPTLFLSLSHPRRSGLGIRYYDRIKHSGKLQYAERFSVTTLKIQIKLDDEDNPVTA